MYFLFGNDQQCRIAFLSSAVIQLKILDNRVNAFIVLIIDGDIHGVDLFIILHFEIIGIIALTLID